MVYKNYYNAHSSLNTKASILCVSYNWKWREKKFIFHARKHGAFDWKLCAFSYYRPALLWVRLITFAYTKKQQLCISLTTISFFLVFILSIRFERIIMKTLSAFILDLQESYMHRWPEWESDLHTIFPWYISSDFTSACFLFVLLIWWKRLLFLYIAVVVNCI